MLTKYFQAILGWLCILCLQGYSQSDSLRTESRRLEPLELNREAAGVISPIVSSVLVGPGQWEFNHISAFQTREFALTQAQLNSTTVMPDTVTNISRNSSLDHVFQIQYGLSRNYRFNIGLELYVSQFRNDMLPDRSGLEILNKADENAVVLRDITAIGPRIRWVPFGGLPEFSVQAAALFGQGTDLAKRTTLGAERTQFQSLLVFYQQFGQRFNVLLQSGASIVAPNEKIGRDITSFSIPAYAQFSAQLTGLGANDFPKLFGFGSGSYAINIDQRKGADESQTSSFLQIGLGVSLQLSPNWSLFVLAQRVLDEETEPEFEEDIAIEQNNWNGLALGLRVLIPGPCNCY